MMRKLIDSDQIKKMKITLSSFLLGAIFATQGHSMDRIYDEEKNPGTPKQAATMVICLLKKGQPIGIYRDARNLIGKFIIAREYDEGNNPGTPKQVATMVICLLEKGHPRQGIYKDARTLIGKLIKDSLTVHMDHMEQFRKGGLRIPIEETYENKIKRYPVELGEFPELRCNYIKEYEKSRSSRFPIEYVCFPIADLENPYYDTFNTEPALAGKLTNFSKDISFHIGYPRGNQTEGDEKLHVYLVEKYVALNNRHLSELHDRLKEPTADVVLLLRRGSWNRDMYEYYVGPFNRMGTGEVFGYVSFSEYNSRSLIKNELTAKESLCSIHRKHAWDARSDEGGCMDKRTAIGNLFYFPPQ